MKGYIFDLDGTLLDSLSLWLTIDQEYMSRHGIEYKREYTDHIKTLTFDECAHYFKETLGVKRSIEEIQADWNEMSTQAYFHELSLKPYAKDYVRQCAEEGICVLATSCQHDKAVAALKRNGIYDCFAHVITTNELGVNKDNPLIYQTCAKLMGLEVQDCTVFEDIVSGCKTAYESGFQVVGVYDAMWEHEQDQLAKVTHQIIHSFEELLD